VLTVGLGATVRARCSLETLMLTLEGVLRATGFLQQVDLQAQRQLCI